MPQVNALFLTLTCQTVILSTNYQPLA